MLVRSHVKQFFKFSVVRTISDKIFAYILGGGKEVGVNPHRTILSAPDITTIANFSNSLMARDDGNSCNSFEIVRLKVL